ncbi:ATP-binding protein [Ferrimicrobium sp.]|uniref:ATP-binding protein n=1 Tax=Ferrimicrobium sp. TaxID=2926050 RepID=UPI00263648D9|nr:ATP-binding protein [Ferrimicrobium sp.]
MYPSSLARTHLLIADDRGILPISPLDSKEVLDLLDDRGENGSLIISSQLPASAWQESLGERTVVTVIIDRIISTAMPVEATRASIRQQPRQGNGVEATSQGNGVNERRRRTDRQSLVQ